MRGRLVTRTIRVIYVSVREADVCFLASVPPPTCIRDCLAKQRPRRSTSARLRYASRHIMANTTRSSFHCYSLFHTTPHSATAPSSMLLLVQPLLLVPPLLL